MICRSFPVCSTQMERKKAGMKCVIFAGLPAAPELHSWWADADYVIAADAGYENACRVGVEPDLLLGDYDSAPRPEAGAKTVFLPAEKDDTEERHEFVEIKDSKNRIFLQIISDILDFAKI